jgi:hypothetical protein
MGRLAGGPFFGVHVKNLTIDGSNRAATALMNRFCEEQCYGEDLLLVNFTYSGLDIQGSGAQNSGPFRDLEIYPGAAATSSAVCVVVSNVISFRGIDGVTCNASGYRAKPQVGLLLDGGALYTRFHVEHVATGVQLGSGSQPADGLTLQNIQAGPDVQTAVVISNRQDNQNVTLNGLKCNGCVNVLQDYVMHNSTRWDVGSYILGNGAGASKRVTTSAADIAQENQ